MYELLFSSQQPKTKDFRKNCCNVLFPQVRQQLSDKSHAMENENLTSRVQALEFTNEEERQAHQQAIEEKDATIALLNDDLKNREHIMWHCRHRGRSIRTSYKNVKTSLPILGHVMFLMQKIQAKITLL